MLTNVESDSELIEIWLSQKSENTRRAYRKDVEVALEYLDEPLEEIDLEEVIRWRELLEQRYANSTVRRRVTSLRSLLKFGYQCGYLDRNVGRLVTVPKQGDNLSERILPREDILSIINARTGRDELILRTLYVLGLRVAELCSLKWRNLKFSGDSGIVHVRGKGNKDRTIRVPKVLWQQIVQRRNEDDGPDDPVFRSAMGGHLSSQRVSQIVRRASMEAGIDLEENPVSPHWFRHAHASHALDRGVPIHVVRDTLGHASLKTTSRYLHARPDESSADALV